MQKLIAGILLLSLISVAFVADDITENKVKVVHSNAFTIDTHVDTPAAILNLGLDLGKRNPPGKGQVDFIRMKEGGLDAIFFAIFTEQKNRTPENTAQAYNLAHRMIDSTYAACKKYSHLAQIVTTADDANRVAVEGKRAIYLGLENGFPLGADISRVKEFYDRGIRYITLSHSANNNICDSSTDENGPEHNGLSNFGRQVVSEMNRLGIMIDVSHISDKAFFDVIKLSKAPVLASHSNVRAIAGHARNMSDDMIKTLAENGGVIQVSMVDVFVKNPDPSNLRYKKLKELQDIRKSSFDKMNKEEQETLMKLLIETDKNYPRTPVNSKDLVDHIDYIKNLVGIDYVGIGSDFDGGGILTDCEDVSELPNITREMLKRGYTQEEIFKVWGGNFFRVFREVEKYAIK